MVLSSSHCERSAQLRRADPFVQSGSRIHRRV